MSDGKKPSESVLSRRSAVEAGTKTVAGLGLAVTGLCGCGSSKGSDNGSSPPTASSTVAVDATGNATLSFAAYPNLQQAGGSYLVNVAAASGTKVVSVVRADTATVAAVSPVCTHQGCALNAFSGGQYYCACHGSTFSATGGVTAGPARSSLPSYPAQLTPTGVQITVT